MRWEGVVNPTKDTSGSSCGGEPGEKYVVTYRPYLDAGDPPSSMVIDFFDTMIHLLNRDATSQFHGSGRVLATGVLRIQVEALQKVKGNYNITLDPTVITEATSTIRVPSGKVTLNVPGLGKCIILTPRFSEE